MDPAIWGSLPDELLDHVLRFLPMKSAITLRPTCKRFKSFILSTDFLSKIRSPSPFSSSFLVLFHPHFHHHFLLYDSHTSSWRNSFVALNTSSSSSSLFSSSCNGLLCFSLPISSSFLIFNLLFQSTKLVPFPGRQAFSFEILSLVPQPNGFKLLTIPSGPSSNSVFIYDSMTESWTVFRVQVPISSDHNNQEGVVANGSFYFTTSQPVAVVSLDLVSGELRSPGAELPGELVFARLVREEAAEGRIYMVGGVGRDGISRSLKVWEMEEGGGSWLEMETLPQMMYTKFMSVCYHNYEHVYCFWHQGMLCICCSTWPEILYYRVARRTWHWLSRCPSLPEKWRCGFRWVSFVPKLCVPLV